LKETSGAPRNPQGQIGAKRIDTHRDGRRDYPSRQSNRRRRLNSIDSARGEAYLPQTSPPVYQRLRDLASLALASGQSTILDAVHLRHEDRAAAERVATQNNAHFTGLWLEAPLGILRERVAKRAMDASDATIEVLAGQAKHSGPTALRE
jgi:predicted kinase